jgi:hypothetical protein
VWSADVEDEDALQFWKLDELDAVRRQELADASRWLAARVRLELVLSAIGVDRSRPWLKRDLRTGRIGCGRAATARKPDPLLARRRENRATIRIARRGCGRRSGLTTSGTTLCWGCRRATASIGNTNLHTWTCRLLWLLLLAQERVGQNGRQEQRRGSTQRKAMSHRSPH